jgi:molybdopterin synthase catalytic subunit
MIELTEKPIDLARVMATVARPECGAEVLFVGTTRRWTKRENASGDWEDIETSHLFYEAFSEMAISQMEALAREACTRWPVKALALVHRLGRVDPQEASVAVAVSCPHRSESFEAAKWLIDTIKHDVPIWKQEHYVQSGAEWIHPTSGSCRCDHSTQASEPAFHSNIAQQQSQQQ